MTKQLKPSKRSSFRTQQVDNLKPVLSPFPDTDRKSVVSDNSLFKQSSKDPGIPTGVSVGGGRPKSRTENEKGFKKTKGCLYGDYGIHSSGARDPDTKAQVRYLEDEINEAFFFREGLSRNGSTSSETTDILGWNGSVSSEIV